MFVEVRHVSLRFAKLRQCSPRFNQRSLMFCTVHESSSRFAKDPLRSLIFEEARGGSFKVRYGSMRFAQVCHGSPRYAKIRQGSLRFSAIFWVYSEVGSRRFASKRKVR